MPENTTPGEPRDFAEQEIRIAAVLNGGVSLAVWMSGVTLELHHLALASRGLGRWPAYRHLLDLLRATARVDVIAGTSAGGLNGAFLALGQARRRDFSLLRDVWVSEGSLEKLLRPALEKNPPAPLRGDAFFLPRINDALTSMLSAANPALESAAASEPPPVELVLTGTLWSGRESTFTDDMGVSITERDYDATFRFTNQIPAGLEGTVGDLDAADTVPLVAQLANAARCTSSFPAAFEPHYVRTATDRLTVPGRTASSAGQANFTNSQYVLDGGVLLNKPIRPALDAIYRQSAQNEVRRVLVYVVPDPGEPPRPGDPALSGDGAGRAADTALPPVPAPGPPPPVPPAPPTPEATDVLLSVMTRLRSTDSVSRELSEIRDNNAAVVERRRARARFATALTRTDGVLSSVLYPGYREERRETGCRHIGELLARGQRADVARWSDSELGAALERITRPVTGDTEPSTAPATDTPPPVVSFVPPPDLDEALDFSSELWLWGQTTLGHMGDLASDLLRRALVLAPLAAPQRREIVECRARLAPLLVRIGSHARALDRFWIRVAHGPETPAGRTVWFERSSSGPAATVTRVASTTEPVPPRRSAAPQGRSGNAGNQDELEAWLRPVLTDWDNARIVRAGDDGSAAPPTLEYALPSGGIRPDEPDRRHGQWLAAVEIAGALLEASAAIADLLQQANPAVDPTGSALAELRSLHDWLLAGAGEATQVLERMLRLEIVQVASGSEFTQLEQEVELVQVSCGDRERVTGLQLHHFGAFYRAPWRSNDWVEGRVDGARQIVRFVLSPDRLRQLALTPEDLLDQLHAIAVPTRPDGTPDPDLAWLETEWQASRSAYLDEIGSALSPATATAALDTVSDAVSKPIVLAALAEDLPSLAETIRAEGADMAVGSRVWLDSYDNAVRSVQSHNLRPQVLWALYEQMSSVGSQKIADDVGSDTFARTVSHAAVIATGTFAGPSSRLGRLKAVQGLLGSVRGYAALVWAMVTFMTRGSEFGARAVQLAVAAGGVLLAVAVIVPGVPSGLTVLGVVLFLAGASAAALLTRNAFWLGVRVLLAALAVAAVGGYPAVRYLRDHGFDAAAQSVVIKIGVGMLVVLLGWFIAWNGRRLSITVASVRWRGVALGVGVAWWSVVTIVLLHQTNTHERVWSRTGELALLVGLAALVQVLVYSGSVGARPWARVVVALTLAALAGAVASAVLHLLRRGTRWLVDTLDWFLTASLLLAALVVAIALVSNTVLLAQRAVAAPLALVTLGCLQAAWAAAPSSSVDPTAGAIVLGLAGLAAGAVFVFAPSRVGARP